MLLALVIGTLAAYGFSRYPLKGNDTYLFIILTTRMLPAIVVIIPIFLMFRVAGPCRHLSRHHPALHGLQPAFTIWMMKSFFDELSPDVEDAARIDGIVRDQGVLQDLPAAGHGRPCRHRRLRPDPHLERVPVRAAADRASRRAPCRSPWRRPIGGDIGVRWGLLAAIETLFLIPVILVTFFLQNHLLRGVTFGTIKR